MRIRTLIHAAVCLLTPLLILACSVMFTGGSLTRWTMAHRDIPLLWLIDFCALYTFILLASAITSWDRAKRRETELVSLRQEHLSQLEAVVAQASDFDRENAELQDKISSLEESRALSVQDHDREARELAEQVFRAIQGQMEAQGRQLEAVNLALQHHRAEISQLRQGLKGVQQYAVTRSEVQITPDEYEAIFAPETADKTERDDTFALAAVPRYEPGSNGQAHTPLLAKVPPQAVAESHFGPEL